MRKAAGIGSMVAFLLSAATMAPPAFAYRPFDGTDASVADKDEFELEFGPLGHLREGGKRAWLGPAFVANWGLEHDRELVFEGKVKTLIGDREPGASRASLTDTALSLKQLHRRGSLQDEAGVSIASECGILLPTVHDESGTGATCAGILSHRWEAVTVHVNGALAFGRQHKWTHFVGGIVEGPDKWAVRPVAEIFTERTVGGPVTNSALVGLIWKRRENLSFDLGYRRARMDGEPVNEFRAGLTWATSFGH